MDNEFKEELGNYVAEPKSIEEQLEEASRQFEDELAGANKDNVSPIMDLKSTKEKEAALRAEIKRALQDKIDSDVELADAEIAETEETQEDIEPQVVDGDELIVEDRSLESDSEDKKVIEPKGYIAKLDKLHEMKMKMYRQQVAAHSINVNEDEFYKTIKYEKDLLILRGKYSEEEIETIKEYEDKYKQEEMAEQKKVRDELKIQVLDYDKLITELKEINDEISYVQKMQLQSTDRDGGKITEEDAKRRLLIANEKKMRLLAEISLINPELLIEEIQKKKQMDTEEKSVVGYTNMEAQAEDLSDETKANERYANSQEGKTIHKLEDNCKYYLEEVRERNAENKYQLYKLQQQLDELPENPATADDLAKKAKVLQQMQEVKGRINQGEDIENRMQNNMNSNSEDITAFIAADKEYAENYKETEKNFKETDEYVDIAENIEGKAAVASPTTIDNDEGRELTELVASGAAGMAIGTAASGNIPAAAGYAVVSAALVRDVNNYDDAKAYLEVAENSEQIQREREQAQTELEAAEDRMIKQ